MITIVFVFVCLVIFFGGGGGGGGGGGLVWSVTIVTGGILYVLN